MLNELFLAAAMLLGAVGCARLVDLWEWFRIPVLSGTLTSCRHGEFDDDGVYVISGAADTAMDGTFRLPLRPSR